MKIVAVLAATFSMGVLAQSELEKKPIRIESIEAGAARQASEIIDVLYRSPAIREQCLQTPGAKLDVALNGYKVPLDCSLWNIWYRRALEIAQ